ncbi:DUF2079 domain-containing protein [Rothia sp. CCM 9418]|uniref:DUF2079 domain-containing protein n=1 Tax=Rothia sp. CCM 9418 TaxID=3402661 RepID=UPI003AE28E17
MTATAKTSDSQSAQEQPHQSLLSFISTSRLTAWTLAFALFAFYSLYSYFQYVHYHTPSWDLGIFSQLAQEYSQLHFPPIVDIKGSGFNLWGDHFHPILIILGPIYALFPSPATLLYVQNALVAYSAYLLCRYAQQVIPPIGAITLTIAYGLSFGVQNAVSVQFHEVAFALPFLCASLGNIVLSQKTSEPVKNLKRACYWAMPIAFVKEDLGITVATIALVIAIRAGTITSIHQRLFPSASSAPPVPQRMLHATRTINRHDGSLHAVLLLFWGIMWSLLSVLVILPAYNSGGVFDYSDKLNLSEILSDPLQSFGLLFYPWQKTLTLVLLLFSGVFLWVLSPLALIALPTILWRFLSPHESYWAPTWHYSLVLMPIVFMALLDALLSMHRFAPLRYLSAKAQHLFALSTQRAQELTRTSFLWLAFLIVIVSFPYQPLWKITHTGFLSSSLSVEEYEKQQALESIPAHSSVASDLSLLTYLVPEHQVFWIGDKTHNAHPQYVVIDRAGGGWGKSAPKDPAHYARKYFGGNYREYQRFGTIYVLERVGA